MLLFCASTEATVSGLISEPLTRFEDRVFHNPLQITRKPSWSEPCQIFLECFVKVVFFPVIIHRINGPPISANKKKTSILWHHDLQKSVAFFAIEDESGASFPALIRPSIFFTSMKTCHRSQWRLTSQFPPQKLWRVPWNNINRDSHDSKCLKEKPTCFENCNIHFGKSIDSQ